MRASDRFWIKSQPYSLRHMLADDPVHLDFVGGTVYQSFLSAFSYHRWHCPLSGTVAKVRRVPGTYFSESRAAGFDPEAANGSQGYLSSVAARTLIYIEANDPDIGLMCFIAIGNAEVSSCEVVVQKGQKVCKGDEMGTFHYGGSTTCMVFKPSVQLKWDLRGQTPSIDSSNIPVNAAIAEVMKSTRGSCM